MRANQVDHIIEIQKGGAWWDESNLRAACGTCNRKRNKGGQSFRYLAGATHITLVIGPPGVDLLAYVREQAGPTDVIADLGDLTRAVGEAGAERAMVAIVDQLRRAEVKASRAWITSHSPTAEGELPHHQVIVIGGGEAGHQDWLQRRRGVDVAVGPSRDW